MTANTMTVEAGSSASIGWCFSLVPGSGASTSVPARVSRHVPPAVSAGQAYFWTQRWQEREARAARDLAAGRVHEFNDPAAAARYLLSTDE